MRLCYIHVYKCGGTSMREYIKEHLATPETVIVDQWAYEWEREIRQRDRVFGNIARSEYLRQYGAHAGPIVILTHSFFYEFMKRWTDFSFATMLRDPVKRAVSQFHFESRTFDFFKEDNLTRWLDSLPPFELNMQTAAFSGAPGPNVNETHLEMAKANLHYFDFVGLVDRYESSLKLFNRIYGIKYDGPPLSLNASPTPFEVPPILETWLRQRCQYDIDLLEYGARLFQAKRAAFEMIDAGDPSLPPPSIK